MGISIDWAHRCGITDALLLLWQQEDLRDHRHLLAALGSILNASVPPSPKDPDQAMFLRSAVKLYQTVNGSSEDFTIELLTQYLEGDQAYKNYVRNILIDQGLQDPHIYLGKELESWEIWNLDETKPVKAQIRTMVQRWFTDWQMRFRNHLEQTMEQLRRGDIKGKIRRSGQSKTSEGKRVQFAVQPTEASLKNVTPIEVINYFCEIMLEEELERVRLANVKPEPNKNTVLVLPKLDGPQAIVRLGEMHTAQRVRQRQELAFEYRVNPLVRPYPDLMANFTNKLNLPVSRVPLNPFPSEIDMFDEHLGGYQSVLITLQSNTHQKYFVPEKSYVHMAY
uniref:WD repeat-containing protein 97-like n=1 Tax=Phallusia mammillata TaxID=59560 RepID=A0A6F9DX77_9ASCI|nr:WD repeat-containing protein 97-like [Phallusia mammillata]